MKIKRKIIFFLALISLFYCVSIIQETYAKYISSATANTEVTIARWSVLINDQDIVQNSDFSETISPVFTGTSNIKSDVIAPTSEGYFDIEINGNNADVSFTYNLSISLSTQNTVKDIILSKYEIDGIEYEFTDEVDEDVEETPSEIDTEENETENPSEESTEEPSEDPIEEEITRVITGDVLLSDTNRIHTIRVYVKWNDDEATQEMDNFEDANASVSGVSAFDVNVNVIQKQ